MIPAWAVTAVKVIGKLLKKGGAKLAGGVILNFILNRVFNGLLKGKNKLAKKLDNLCYKIGFWISERANKFAKKKKVPKFWEGYGEPLLIRWLGKVEEGMKAQNGQ